jgi:hypothetical protein
MKARREEEAIIADGHRERGLCRGRVFGSGPGGYRADEGHSTFSQLFSSRVAPQLKRAVFPDDGRKIGLLPHDIDKAAK